MNPISALARLRSIGRRRPVVVTIVGLGLLGEAGRVGWGVATAAPVMLFGHSGGTAFDGVADRGWLLAYAGWVALCGGGVIGALVVEALARRRERRRAEGVGGAVRARPASVVTRRGG